MLGKTGVGKSLLGNVLVGMAGFEVSDHTHSCTDRIERIPNFERKIVVYDTKGLNDTRRIIENKPRSAEDRQRLIAGKVYF